MLPAASTEEFILSTKPCRQFTYHEINAATRNFNSNLKLRNDGSGSVYKGVINNEFVTISQLVFDSDRSSSKILVEVERLDKLQHPNILRFIGYCKHEKHMFLVFEFMSEGSLRDQILHKYRHAPFYDRNYISLLTRLKICIDVARALDYLHNQGFVHGDVTSSKVLLDHKLTAKITGGFGYGASEYIATGHKYTKSDVYSFGVILLEVLCRRPAWRQPYLVAWAQHYLNEGKLKKIIDQELEGQMSHKCLNDLAKIVECCLHADPQSRSTMAEVLVGFESILAQKDKTDPIPQMDNTTSDMSLRKHIYSSGLNSEEGYFRKPVNFLSSKSLKHKDHGNISDIEAISEAFKKKNLKHAIEISSDKLNPPSGPNRESIDEGILSTSRTESSHDSFFSNYIQ